MPLLSVSARVRLVTSPAGSTPVGGRHCPGRRADASGNNQHENAYATNCQNPLSET
jgi:hypothetical protein